MIAYNYTPVDWVPPDGFTPPSIDPNTDPIFLDVPSSFNTGLPGPSDPGSTGTGSVTPEPASWALMLVGFGALGAALGAAGGRRRSPPEPAVAVKYAAFISYNHRDRKTAAWLHRALETYRVPRHMHGRETHLGVSERACRRSSATARSWPPRAISPHRCARPWRPRRP